MNINTGMEITRSQITTIPLTDMVKRRVEDMAIQQGHKVIRFTDKKGIELPHADWIAGVDYDDIYPQNAQNDNNEANEEENKDEEYNPTTYEQDVRLTGVDEIEPEEIEDLRMETMEENNNEEENQDNDEDQDEEETSKQYR